MTQPTERTRQQHLVASPKPQNLHLQCWLLHLEVALTREDSRHCHPADTVSQIDRSCRADLRCLTLAKGSILLAMTTEGMSHQGNHETIVNPLGMSGIHETLATPAMLETREINERSIPARGVSQLLAGTVGITERRTAPARRGRENLLQPTGVR